MGRRGPLLTTPHRRPRAAPLQVLTSYLSDLNPATRDALLVTLQTEPGAGAYSPPRAQARAQAQHNQHQQSHGKPSSVKGPRARQAGSTPQFTPQQSVGDASESYGTGQEGDELTCQFCGAYDEGFDEEKLDLHFWKECPLLMSCEQCGQIVEIVGLTDHLVGECDQSQPYRYTPGTCLI